MDPAVPLFRLAIHLSFLLANHGCRPGAGGALVPAGCQWPPGGWRPSSSTAGQSKKRCLARFAHFRFLDQ